MKTRKYLVVVICISKNYGNMRWHRSVGLNVSLRPPASHSTLQLCDPPILSMPCAEHTKTLCGSCKRKTSKKKSVELGV